MTRWHPLAVLVGASVSQALLPPRLSMRSEFDGDVPDFRGVPRGSSGSVRPGAPRDRFFNSHLPTSDGPAGLGAGQENATSVWSPPLVRLLLVVTSSFRSESVISGPL